MAFVKGDRYKYYMLKSPKGTRIKNPVARECTIVQETDRFVTVDFGNYKESISKASMLTRDEWMEKVI